MGNHPILNPLLFERNLTKDYEDAAKNPAVSNNYANRFPAPVPHKPLQ